MNEYEFFVGVDWGRELDQACLINGEGAIVAERGFKHGGKGLNELTEWISNKTGDAAI